MKTAIASFSGEYRFLSNFWPCEIEYKGFLFPSTENAYQWAKSETETEKFQTITVGQAKRLGKELALRRNWNDMRFNVMYDITKAKYTTHGDLRMKLTLTDGIELVEGNTWGDVYWGQCPIGVGKNTLGKILMLVRDEILERTFF